MTEIKCKSWYVDVTLDGETDTHTVHLPKPGAEMTAITWLFYFHLRRFSDKEMERMVIEAVPADPSLFFERSKENDTQ